jgi:hypothetical protein
MAEVLLKVIYVRHLGFIQSGFSIGDGHRLRRGI